MRHEAVCVPVVPPPTHFLFVNDLINRVLDFLPSPNAFVYAIKSLSVTGNEIFYKNYFSRLSPTANQETRAALLKIWYQRFIIQGAQGEGVNVALPFISRLSLRLEQQCNFNINKLQQLWIQFLIPASIFFHENGGMKVVSAQGKGKLQDLLIRYLALFGKGRCLVRETLTKGIANYYPFSLIGFLYITFVTACVIFAMEASTKGCFVVTNTTKAIGRSCDASYDPLGSRIYSCVGNADYFANNSLLLKTIQEACAPFHSCGDVMNLPNSAFLIKLCDAHFRGAMSGMLVLSIVTHFATSIFLSMYLERRSDFARNWFLLFVIFGALIFPSATIVGALNLLVNAAFLIFGVARTTAECIAPSKKPKISEAGFFSLCDYAELPKPKVQYERTEPFSCF